MPAPSSTSPLVLGVLGGVASGKSTAARLLAGREGVVIAADPLAHEVLASPEVAVLVAERFGQEVLDAEGRVDRTALGSRAFADPAGRKALEGWIHPRVRERIRAALDEARSAGAPRVVLDVPLLMENDADHGLVAACDHLVFIEVPDEVRDARAQRDRGWAPGEVARREAAQLPLSEKRTAAGWVLEADCPRDELPARVEALVQRIEATRPPHSSP